MDPIRIFLVDDKEIFREGLARLLREQSDIQLVFQSENILLLVEQISMIGADILLIDIDIKQKETLEALRQINRVLPDTKIAVLTDSQEKENFMTAIEIGAKGYLSKNVSFEELLDSVRLIARGELVISPSFSEQFFFAALRTGKQTMDAKLKTGLSERELEVLTQVTYGSTNREIGGRLYISENTVKVHLKNILDKLQLRNRQQLAVYAVQQGLTTAVGEKIA